LPKVDVYGDQLFVMTRTAHLERDHIAYGETAIFVGKNFIITVRHGSARAHSDLRAQLEAAPSLLSHGPDYVLHAILDFIVDGYLPVVETIEERVLNMEQSALDSFLSRSEVKRLFGLRQELIRFQRIIGPMTEVCGRLVHLETPCLDANARPYFQDVLDHVRRVEAMGNSLRDVLTSVFEVSNLLEQQRQGVITRQLAAWAAILAVPTAIAGIYGMNFDVTLSLLALSPSFAQCFTCVSNALGGSDTSGSPRCRVGLIHRSHRGRVPALGVKVGRTQSEQMSSGLPLRTDISRRVGMPQICQESTVSALTIAPAARPEAVPRNDYARRDEIFGKHCFAQHRRQGPEP
jgi:hypothetical protein